MFHGLVKIFVLCYLILWGSTRLRGLIISNEVTLVTWKSNKLTTIHFTVSGGWSSWSSWSTCSVSCGKGFKRRSRVCDNPLPLNGERPCPGQSTQKKSCEFNCPGKFSL